MRRVELSHREFMEGCSSDASNFEIGSLLEQLASVTAEAISVASCGSQQVE